MSENTTAIQVSPNNRYSQYFWRSWAIQDSWNYERQMNMGFLYGIAPTIDRLYPDENDPEQVAKRKEAYSFRRVLTGCYAGYRTRENVHLSDPVLL